MNNEIAETLKTADIEGTESPYWLIIDPSKVTGRLAYADEDGAVKYADVDHEKCDEIAEAIPNAITGPFFCRGDAEAHLQARDYAFGSNAYVYCHSGYWSRKYKSFCRSLAQAATDDQEQKK